ncbi:MAG: aminotransferase class I/II-fold pyridoxal phosphate-dependent enzyme [Oligoflexia bacterium]|nr:aminotransferase class I/II-fold pyridoxal phosphate-dependent enzyme [Oligoflexia bacterium]
MILPFDEKNKKEYYKLLDKVFESNFWSEGLMVKEFENKFSEYTNLNSAAVTNGGTALLTILSYLKVQDKEVIVPTNTFYATSQAVKMAGATVVYADCNKYDLCISLEDIKKKVTEKTKVIIVVHIGGHIAFDIDELVKFCDRKKIFLVEDCAHAHGGIFNGRMAGDFGIAGAYSFYSTKTMPTGEGGMIVSKDNDLIEWTRLFRNYGKKVIDGKVNYPLKNGFNYRMNEFTAALGIVQMQRLNEILNWKTELAQKYDEIFQNKINYPCGMKSGYYKYIIFEYSNLKIETGKVFNKSDFGHIIDGLDIKLPNSEWIADNHKCPPIYFGWEYANKNISELKTILLN